MKFEPKISGTRVYDFQIEPIFDSQLVTLNECMKKIQHQETMNFILDNFRFSKANENYPGEWYAIFDWDTIMKISVMENYPEYEKELTEYFGNGWTKQYIRFNH